MWSEQIFFFLDLFGSIAVFLLGYYVFSSDPKRKINRFFFLMSMAGALWGISCAGWMRFGEEFWNNIGWIGVSFLGSLFLHLSLVITEKKEILRRKIFLIFLYLLSFLFSAFPNIVKVDLVFYILFVIYFESCLLTSVILLVKRYSSLKSHLEKDRLRSFLIGALIPIIGASITDVFLPLFTTYHIDIESTSKGPGFFLFALGYLFVARGILQFRLFIDYREILETIFKRLAELVIVTDRGGLILLTNDITLKKLNFTKEEVKGKKITDLLGKEKWEKLKEKLKEGAVLKDRVYFKTKEKDNIPFLLAISKTKEGIIFVGRDIREIVLYQEKLEREVQKRTKELEGAKTILEVKVKERTKELQELADSLEAKVKERTKELQARVDELERFHKLTTGRELKMIELKRERLRDCRKRLRRGRNNLSKISLLETERYYTTSNNSLI